MNNMKKTLAIVAVVLGIGIVGLFQFFNKQPGPIAEHALILPEPRAIAPFNLVDNKGNAFTEKNLLGQWDVLFFGYTSCPDICPATLQIMQKAWEQLAQKNATNDLRFIFVTVDPARDTSQQLNNYLNYFNPAFVGLTGDEQQITNLSEQFGVYFMKNIQNGDQQNYLMEHTGSVMFIDPKGRYYANLSPPFDADILVRETLAIKASY
jgi:protein SCO1/2